MLHARRRVHAQPGPNEGKGAAVHGRDQDKHPRGNHRNQAAAEVLDQLGKAGKFHEKGGHERRMSVTVTVGAIRITIVVVEQLKDGTFRKGPVAGNVPRQHRASRGERQRRTEQFSQPTGGKRLGKAKDHAGGRFHGNGGQARHFPDRHARRVQGQRSHRVPRSGRMVVVGLERVQETERLGLNGVLVDQRHPHGPLSVRRATERGGTRGPQNHPFAPLH